MTTGLKKASEEWIAGHPYLESIGGLYMAIYDTAASFEVKSEAKPDWAEFKKNMEKGASLFQSSGVDFLDFEAVGKILAGLAELHKKDNLPDKFRGECLAISEALGGNIALCGGLAKDVLETGGAELEKFSEENKLNKGLLSFLVWTSVKEAFEPYRKEAAEAQKTWIFGTCPTCGMEPATAKLKRTSRGRERFLACGHCGTEWSYKRVGCPYCGNDVPKTLEVIEAEGEKDIRLDVCHKCGSYIKTYLDKGKNAAAIEDWASMHVDILCNDTKYKKRGGLFVWK